MSFMHLFKKYLLNASMCQVSLFYFVPLQSNETIVNMFKKLKVYLK